MSIRVDTGLVRLPPRRSVERDAAGRPVGREDLADQVLPRDQAPTAGVARGTAVVSHHQVVVLRYPRVRLPRWNVGERHALVAATVGFDVGLDQLPAVDVHEAVALLPDLTRQADQSLDERSLRTALLQRELRSFEHDDLSA